MSTARCVCVGGGVCVCVGGGGVWSVCVCGVFVMKFPLALQKKYKDEAERLKGSFCLGAQTPEMERVKLNQQHISSVSRRFYSVL